MVASKCSLPANGPSAAQAMVGDFTIEYSQVAEPRVTRTVFDYTYTATATNNGAFAADVTATVMSTSESTLVVVDDLHFGSVGAGATVPGIDYYSGSRDKSELSPPHRTTRRTQALAGRLKYPPIGTMP